MTDYDRASIAVREFVCKVVADLRAHFLLYITESVSIDVFQGTVRTPSTSFHDVMIRYTNSVKNGCLIVSEIMKPEVR